MQQDILDDFVERPKAATIGKRIGAAIVDGLILLIVMVILGNLFGEHIYRTTTSTITSTSEDGTPDTHREVTTSSEVRLNTLGTVLYIGCWIVLLPVLEGRSGQTVRKRVLRIKVIRMNGDPTNVGISFSRHFFDFVDCFLLIGLIVAACNPLHKRIADGIVGTCVVDAV